jgi:hypothetical protein
VNNIWKTMAGLALACAVGLGETLGRGGVGGFSRVGKTVEAFETARLPSGAERTSDIGVNALSVLGKGTQVANAQSGISPAPDNPAADIASADNVEDVAKFFPGSVTIGHRWLVARVQVPGKAPAVWACMAVVKDGQHGMVMYSAKTLPFSMAVTAISKSGDPGPGTKFRVSIDGMPTERFKRDEYYEFGGGWAGRVFITEQMRPPIVQRLRTGKVMTVNVDESSWAIDLTGSEQTIAALYNCVSRINN